MNFRIGSTSRPCANQKSGDDLRPPRDWHFSLTDALAQQCAWNDAPDSHLNQRRAYQWASMHALSPELAAQYRRDPPSLRASSIIDEHAQHPHYQARGERVFCTFAEADDYAERPRRRQAPHTAPNFP
jgi:hypothetical protein